MVLVVKNPPVKAGRRKSRGFNPSGQEIPWRRAWQPTPVFLPGEAHGQRSPISYSPRVAKSQTQLKQLSTHALCFTKSKPFEKRSKLAISSFSLPI